MNKDFLYQLNGDKNGRLKYLLDKMTEDPRIAWHTSAREDFRSLLYLSENFQTIYMGKEVPFAPNFFIFTDADSTLFDRILRSEEDEHLESYLRRKLKYLVDISAWHLHEDERTSIKVLHFENLPDIYCPSDKSIVMTRTEDKSFRRVAFLHVLVNSNMLGEFTLPLIYINAENESFCSRYAIGNVSFSHIVQVRYGGGLGGGGHASGAWLPNVLNKLNTEVFVTDEHLNWQDGDKAALEKYPNLRSDNQEINLPDFYQVPSVSWSYHGDVKWKLVQKKQSYHQNKINHDIHGQ